MMKKMVLVLLILVLLLESVSALAYTGYDSGAHEMIRQRLMAMYSNKRIYDIMNNEIDDPVGLIIDRDKGSVRVVSEALSMEQMLTAQDNAEEIVAGNLLYAAMCISGVQERLNVYYKENGSYHQVDTVNNLEEVIAKIRSYLMLSSSYMEIETVNFQEWKMRGQMDSDPEGEIIGMVTAKLTCVDDICTLNNMDKQLLPNLGECIIQDEGNSRIIIQAEDYTYAFWYNEGKGEKALQLALFNVFLGGVELEEMCVYVRENTEEESLWYLERLETNEIEEKIIGFLNIWASVGSWY